MPAGPAAIRTTASVAEEALLMTLPVATVSALPGALPASTVPAAPMLPKVRMSPDRRVTLPALPTLTAPVEVKLVPLPRLTLELLPPAATVVVPLLMTVPLCVMAAVDWRVRLPPAVMLPRLSAPVLLMLTLPALLTLTAPPEVKLLPDPPLASSTSKELPPAVTLAVPAILW